MIAFFGGTFDPFHLGHLHLAKEVLKKYSFSKFYFIPAHQNPLKDPAPHASDPMRIAMLRAAIQEIQDPRIAVWEGELRRPGKSYTLDTVLELKKETEEELVMILGSDVFRGLPKWHMPEKLLKNVHCVIVEREANCDVNVGEILRSLHISFEEKTRNYFTQSDNFSWIEKINISALPFSSSGLRKEIKECWNKKDLAHPPPGLQHSVWQVIKDNQLYAR